ncbi:unnamed protein product, partial [Mesorhabditis spiculigera]
MQLMSLLPPGYNISKIPLSVVQAMANDQIPDISILPQDLKDYLQLHADKLLEVFAKPKNNVTLDEILAKIPSFNRTKLETFEPNYRKRHLQQRFHIHSLENPHRIYPFPVPFLKRGPNLSKSSSVPLGTRRIEDPSQAPEVFFNNQTTCSCSDYIDGAVIKCSGPQGPVLVERLKSNHVEIRELSLENANIVEIGPNAFKNLRIKKLVLDKNRITGFHKDAFRGLENVLIELSLQQNRMPQVPTDALNGLRALQVLNMRCNKIGNLTTSAFNNLPSLIDINMGCNEICKLDEHSFEGVRSTLQNVILDSNCFTEIPVKAIKGMSNLIGLHLKYNKINKLVKGDLTDMRALSMLTLTGNNISSIATDALVNTPSLRYLYLAENALKTLAPGVMAQFKQAQVVDLSFNDLEEVTPEMFSGLESLQHINLESNAISNLAPGAFEGTPLLLLWLPNNCLTTLNKEMLRGVMFLRQVSLANNNIHIIEPASIAHLRVKEEAEPTDESEEEYEEVDDEEESQTKASKAATTLKPSTTTEAEPEEEEEEEEEVTTPKPHHKINMERFWRLAQHPSPNSPFMRHQKALGVNTAPKVLKGVSAEGTENSSTERRRKFLGTVAPKPSSTTTEGPKEDEYEEEYEGEEEEETEEKPETTTAPSKKVPSRVLERQRWMSNKGWNFKSSEKGSKPTDVTEPGVDFDKDAEEETVQVDEAAPRQ